MIAGTRIRFAGEKIGHIGLIFFAVWMLVRVFLMLFFHDDQSAMMRVIEVSALCWAIPAAISFLLMVVGAILQSKSKTRD